MTVAAGKDRHTAGCGSFGVLVEDGNDGLAFCHGERAARTKIVLHIYNDERRCHCPKPFLVFRQPSQSKVANAANTAIYTILLILLALILSYFPCSGCFGCFANARRVRGYSASARVLQTPSVLPASPRTSVCQSRPPHSAAATVLPLRVRWPAPTVARRSGAGATGWLARRIASVARSRRASKVPRRRVGRVATRDEAHKPLHHRNVLAQILLLLSLTSQFVTPHLRHLRDVLCWPEHKRKLCEIDERSAQKCCARCIKTDGRHWREIFLASASRMSFSLPVRAWAFQSRARR